MYIRFRASATPVLVDLLPEIHDVALEVHRREALAELLEGDLVVPVLVEVRQPRLQGGACAHRIWMC